MNDLVADLSAELAGGSAGVPGVDRPGAGGPGVGGPGVSEAGAGGPGARRPMADGPGRQVPAVTVLFTPLHWSRASISTPPAGAGLVVRGGPWQVDVRL